MDNPQAPAYEERLAVPVVVWVVVFVIEATFALALGAPLGGRVGLPVLALLWGSTGWGLVRATGRITVTDRTLRVGRASLPLSMAGEVTALDAIGARALRGADADPRAFMWLKGWVPTAVRVDVADPGDPTPYWYVSSRRPTDLVAAIDRAR